MRRHAIVLIGLMLATVSQGRADVQPAPPVGRKIIVIGGGVGSYCFDTLQHLTLAEKNLKKWSRDKMNAYLVLHSIRFFGGEKANVLAEYPSFIWSSYSVKPINLLITSSHNESGHNWKGRTCWWEFSQAGDMLPMFTWWK